MTGLPSPRISKNQQNTQLNYELPHQIHTAKAYPIQSPNGSTIFIYGTDNGVRIVWRGGKPFKPIPLASAASQRTNGSQGAVISLDSDEDEMPAAKKFEDKPEFEEDEEDLGPSKPYPEILQTLDLHFGTDAHHLAILPSPILKAEGNSWRSIEYLKKQIVFAAACADTVRLITLPIIPPSPASKERPGFRKAFEEAHAGKGSWGETVTCLTGHQKPCGGVSMTLELNTDKEHAKFETQIVVASYSREVSGLLLLHKIPANSPPASVDLFQKVYLASQAKAISFNPSLTGQRLSHLLVADSKGACRIYDYKTLSAGSDETSESNAAERGSWLLSLYTSFQNTKDSKKSLQPLGSHTGFGRKAIIDAQWISGGKAILVLLDDGEWGVWDVEGTGPGASRGLLGPQGVKGGSISEFSLTGIIDIAAKSRQPLPQQVTDRKFAPMTPSTRRSTDLFGNKISNGAVEGQLSVIEVPSPSQTSLPEESIVFWLGDTYTIIPSLDKYWSANSPKGPSRGAGTMLNSSASGARMIRLVDIRLHGEQCSGIEQIPRLYPKPNELPVDLLVLGEHRFTILTTEGSKTRTKTGRLTLREKDINASGKLDVFGIDQALARMENGSTLGKLF